MSGFRRFQSAFDRTIYSGIPETDIKVAVKLVRDASWLAHPEQIEPEVRHAFRLVLDLLQPAVFWDIGANIGFYSWFVRRNRSVRQVIMFEPDPTNFALIEGTIRKNAISDCRSMNMALADRDGEASFVVDRASGAAGSLEAVSHGESDFSLHHAYAMRETITCRTATIDCLIGGGLPPPNLMKIDVEGGEHLVIAGGARCLAQYRPTMIVETANANLVQQLQELGYAVFRIDGGNLLFLHATTDGDVTSVSRALSRYDCGQ
jgi:FkbM family methyltransferase